MSVGLLRKVTTQRHQPCRRAARYVVATISRLLKIVSLCCKRAQ